MGPGLHKQLCVGVTTVGALFGLTAMKPESNVGSAPEKMIPAATERNEPPTYGIG